MIIFVSIITTARVVIVTNIYDILDDRGIC